ncbi:MAG: hypothetical protein IPK85_10315 [Gemmatimonadetes bacterium]|nr:hypothetical protein [Gemmatimonadota bacterium]
MRMSRSRAIATALLALTAACGGDDADVPTPPGTAALGTFDRIQGQILATTCTAGCHTQGAAFAQSSGLVLDRAVAYTNLVGAPPKNAAAKADGLLRVQPFRSDSSLLYHKLVIADGHHSPSYGSPMPLGGQVVTNGELEYIRRWIEAGAPEKGSVVDTAVLADRARPVATPFTPLAPPAQGVQLKIESFSVSPNFERELFVYRRVNNGADVFVDRIETRMRTNSHHLLLYTFENIPQLIRPSFDVIRDIRHPDGTLNLLNMLPMGFHVFFAGTQTPTSDYRFPAGVALRLPAQGTLDLNAHYVNRTTAPIAGEAYINLHTVPSASVQRVARTLNMGNTDLTLPPGTRTTITKTFRVSDSTMTIFMLTSHMHERGERFVVKVTGGPRDGEVVYTTTDWAHPDIVTYAQPIVLRRGEGLTSEITYNNTTTRTIRFGLTSADEMGIIFGYYY